LRQAEDILEVACSGESAEPFSLLWTADGSLRLVAGGDWSLSAIRAEYGARAVFRVERRKGTVRVEGWDGTERCLLERRPRELTSTADHMMWRATGRSNPLATMSGIASSKGNSSSPNSTLTTSQSSDTHRWLTSRYSATSSEPLIATRIF